MRWNLALTLLGNYISLVREVRLSIVGFGTVGRWLAQAVHRRQAWLESECGATVKIVSVATRRDGFIHHSGGLDVPTLMELVAAGRPLVDHPGARRWETALEGLTNTDCDVLAEASNTDPRKSEPALSHLRRALGRGAHVITASKGACAAAALELLDTARRNGVHFRMESTVMSGTPVISTIREGLAGARVLSVRGILNGTANHILTLMDGGLQYPAALGDAQARGYAEPDPSDDVEGHDVVAKVRILAAIAFGQSLGLNDVTARGITGITSEDILQAARAERRIRLVASIRTEPESGPSARLQARVEPLALPSGDPLYHVTGVINALAIETDTLHEVIVQGPGAGQEQAGQGIFADLVHVTRNLTPCPEDGSAGQIR